MIWVWQSIKGYMWRVVVKPRAPALTCLWPLVELALLEKFASAQLKQEKATDQGWFLSLFCFGSRWALTGNVYIKDSRKSWLRKRLNKREYVNSEWVYLLDRRKSFQGRIERLYEFILVEYRFCKIRNESVPLQHTSLENKPKGEPLSSSTAMS